MAEKRAEDREHNFEGLPSSGHSTNGIPLFISGKLFTSLPRWKLGSQTTFGVLQNSLGRHNIAASMRLLIATFSFVSIVSAIGQNTSLAATGFYQQPDKQNDR